MGKIRGTAAFIGTAIGSLLWHGSALADPVQAPSPKCEALRESTVGADRIALPTKGAVITRARMVTPPPAGGGQPYCLVSGEIAPVDPAAAAIGFRIALPTDWNGKALMMGGGGFDGVIPNVQGSFFLAPPGTPTPLARGYAVFADDGGHQAATPASLMPGAADTAFFENEETYRNYMGDAIKKTRDVALAVIETAYGREPAKSYFQGGSKGGQEAMMAVARWPRDWDGAIAWYPARDYMFAMLGVLHAAQVLAAPDAFLDLAKRGVLHQAALAACDGLDGARDGIISDKRGCRAKFDPATAMLNGVPIRCPGGRDTGDSCLSDAQIAALKAIESPVNLGFMPGGPRTFPGFNILTADLGGAEKSPFAPLVTTLNMGFTPPSFPNAEGNWFGAEFVDKVFRFAVARDNAFDYLHLNLADPGPLVPRIQELAQLDQVDRDLSGFLNRGGKLIIIQGAEDMLISPRSTEQYVEALRARMGDARVDRFLRYYEIPGFSHLASTVFNARLDDISMLDAWVERNEDPAQKEVVADTGHGGRTRPLCLYPNWPKYKGSGDQKVASSYVCVAR